MKTRLTTWFVAAQCILGVVGCGPTTSSTGGTTQKNPGVPITERPSANCPDTDADGFGCSNDCDNTNGLIYPGAQEVPNGLDDDCNGKVDDVPLGLDYDRDGFKTPEDCNDTLALVNPSAVEDPSDSIDNNCNGKVDEAQLCDTAGTTAKDFLHAMGLCLPQLDASFPVGTAQSRSIRKQFGTNWKPLQGATLALLSTGSAVDTIEDASYSPQPGNDFKTSDSHPLYSEPKCAAPAAEPPANDMSELSVKLKVPNNANSLSFQFNFFSAEFPEYVCTEFNDRFIVVLSSSSLDVSKLPQGQCKASESKPTCNISYDSVGEPVTINNGFFSYCDSAGGANTTCTHPISTLEGTGYEKTIAGEAVGGATGWLTTTAPVTPNEEITLRFIVLDEGDNIYDSAVLLDNFKWGTLKVEAPVTEPTIN